ncbi:hypothetical protein AVEN_211101-1, partial [Araneus ventricosus]
DDCHAGVPAARHFLSRLSQIRAGSCGVYLPTVTSFSAIRLNWKKCAGSEQPRSLGNFGQTEPHVYRAAVLKGLTNMGLVSGSQLRHQRGASSRPYSTEDSFCMRIKRPPAVIVWEGSLERGVRLKCHLHHLKMVQNYDVCPKIALL